MAKIYIIGSVGSGKTILAKRLSGELNIPYYELDSVTWEYHPNGPDRRRSQKKFNRYFNLFFLSQIGLWKMLEKRCILRHMRKLI